MADLASALKAYRTTTAKALGQPSYCVFSNKDLDALVSARPRSEAELIKVPGFGPSRVQKFGAEIVKICSTHDGAPAHLAATSSVLVAAPPPAPASVKRKLPATFESGSSTAAPPPPLPPTAKIERNTLNDEQRVASDRVLGGTNAFLTGAAGTGKSFLLRYLIQALEARSPGGVAVTAPTGIAASHVQGVTIHSWAGIGLGKGGIAKLVEKVMANGNACARWRKARVLLIDEVSMLDSNLFDALDAIGRAVRGEPRPFGGLQLVMCGDFLRARAPLSSAKHLRASRAPPLPLILSLSYTRAPAPQSCRPSRSASTMRASPSRPPRGAPRPSRPSSSVPLCVSRATWRSSTCSGRFASACALRRRRRRSARAT